ncbi:hypothetical protein J6590_046416 [Homalodisca vitripennis]|nr:hypothetical protein J6590_046416 [Homalodisca vitripennis]
MRNCRLDGQVEEGMCEQMKPEACRGALNFKSSLLNNKHKLLLLLSETVQQTRMSEVLSSSVVALTLVKQLLQLLNNKHNLLLLLSETVQQTRMSEVLCSSVVALTLVKKLLQLLNNKHNLLLLLSETVQ